MHRSVTAGLALILLSLASPFARAADTTEALGEARVLVGRNAPRQAVEVLETALPGVAAEHRAALLDLLRQAYEQAAVQADGEGKAREAAGYRENLAILNRAPAPAASAPAAAPVTLPTRSAATPAPAAADPALPAPPAGPLSLDEAPPEQPAPAPPAASPGPDPQARTDLEAADAAFREGRYDEAGRAYAALAKAGRLPAVRRDPWAYCRMAEVVRRINDRPRTEADWTAIRGEIEQVRQLSPKNWYAEYLRSLATERSQVARKPASGRVVLRGASPEETSPAVAAPRTHQVKAPAADARARVGQPGTPVDGKQVWETANFRIFHENPDLAERVAQIAEAAREEQTRRWSGPAGLVAWSPRCDVYLYPDAAVFHQATGQPAESPGFSTMGLNSGQVVARRMNLRADHPNLLTAILPHEVTHVVLADLFPDLQIPRWADEGMAVLSEPTPEQDLRAADLNGHVTANQLFKLADLMAMDYPDGRFWGLYYAQSVSLTRFLVERGTPAQFVQFVKTAQRTGFENELRRVYKIDGYADLQDRWLAHVRQQPAASAPAGALADAIPTSPAVR